MNTRNTIKARLSAPVRRRPLMLALAAVGWPGAQVLAGAVLNDGFAARFTAAHGPCICAMGWKVGDRIVLEGTIYPGDWEFTVDGIYTATRRSVDRSQFIFHYRYLNDAIPPARRDRIGEIDGIADVAVLQVIADLVGNHLGAVVLGFTSAGTEVGQRNGARVAMDRRAREIAHITAQPLGGPLVLVGCAGSTLPDVNYIHPSATTTSPHRVTFSQLRVRGGAG